MEQKKSIVEILSEIPTEPPIHTHRQWLRRNLPVLRIIHIAGMVTLVLSVLMPTDSAISAITLLEIVLVGAAALCLLLLAPANSRYRNAAIFRGLYLVGLLASIPLNNMGLIMLASSLLSLISTHQEFGAHAELVRKTDEELYGKWHSLFNWYIASLLIAIFVSIILAVVILVLAMDRISALWINTILFSIAAVTYLPELIVDIFYLKYLNRMIRYTKMEA